MLQVSSVLEMKLLLFGWSEVLALTRTYSFEFLPGMRCLDPSFNLGKAELEGELPTTSVVEALIVAEAVEDLGSSPSPGNT